MIHTLPVPVLLTTNTASIRHHMNNEQTFFNSFLTCFPARHDYYQNQTSENSKAPLIRQMGVDIGSQKAKHKLVSGQEAVTRIRENGGSVTGFCIYAGKEAHNTGSLVFVDHECYQTI
jgi:hypothetical protein